MITAACRLSVSECFIEFWVAVDAWFEHMYVGYMGGRRRESQEVDRVSSFDNSTANVRCVCDDVEPYLIVLALVSVFWPVKNFTTSLSRVVNYFV